MVDQPDYLLENEALFYGSSIPNLLRKAALWIENNNVTFPSPDPLGDGDDFITVFDSLFESFGYRLTVNFKSRGE